MLIVVLIAFGLLSQRMMFFIVWSVGIRLVVMFVMMVIVGYPGIKGSGVMVVLGLKTIFVLIVVLKILIFVGIVMMWIRLEDQIAGLVQMKFVQMVSGLVKVIILSVVGLILIV